MGIKKTIVTGLSTITMGGTVVYGLYDYVTEPRFARETEYKIIQECKTANSSLADRMAIALCSCSLALTQEDGFLADYSEESYSGKKEKFENDFIDNLKKVLDDPKICEKDIY